MPQPENKSKFDDFLTLAREIAGQSPPVILTSVQVQIIIAQADWVSNYVEGRKKAVAANANPGAKRKRTSEIKPESVRKRELREMRKNKM